MNERIRQLAEQARHWAHFEGLEQNPTSSPDILFEQKFAELIVRECAGVMQKNVNLNYDHCLDTQILEHFGVEE